MPDNYNAAGELLIQREAAKLEKAKAKAKALEENMEETLINYLKKDSVKRSLARDAMAATKDPSRWDAIFEKANEGVYTDDRDVVTGLEPRPWER